MKINPFKLERYFARYEFSARFLLSSSDCESWSVQELLNLEPGAEDGINAALAWLYRIDWCTFPEAGNQPDILRYFSRAGAGP